MGAWGRREQRFKEGRDEGVASVCQSSGKVLTVFHRSVSKVLTVFHRSVNKVLTVFHRSVNKVRILF